MAFRLKVPQRAPPKAPSRRDNGIQAGGEEVEAQGLISVQGDIAVRDGRPANNQQALRVYRDVLTPLIRRSSIDYSDLLKLAEFRSVHQITESQHFTALSELGITKEGFAQRIKNGQKAPEREEPRVANVPLPQAFPSISLTPSFVPADPVPFKIQHTRWSRVVLLCAIFTGALLGLFVRIGTGELDAYGLAGVSGTVLIANVLGCIVMGFMTRFEHCHMRSRSHDILYIAITSGFCGSLTTFSSLNLEAIKLLFLQWNTHSPLSLHGNYVWQWLLWLWGGVMVPLAALRLGQHLALVCPCGVAAGNRRVRVLWLEVGLVVLFLAAVVAVIAVPLLMSPSSINLTYAGVMGGVGALLRYAISACLNPCTPSFPVGTFFCNLLGTAIMVLVTLVTKFVIHPSEIEALAVCYGVTTGFCGCFTTISSFENELDKLGIANVRSAYVYGLSSIGLAQLISLLLFCLVSQNRISISVRSVSHLDTCSAYNSTCFHALRLVGCSADSMVVSACVSSSPSSDTQSLATFQGICRCGAWDIGQQMGGLLVGTQIQRDISRSLASLWPVDSRSLPTYTFDLCTSFEQACGMWLDRVGCSSDMRVLGACEGRWLENFQGVCRCGKMDGGKRIIELLLGSMLMTKPQDLDKWSGDENYTSTSACEEQEDICLQVLSRIQCPDTLRNTNSCQNSSVVSNFMGVCACGHTIPSDFISSRIVQTQVTAQLQQSAIQPGVSVSYDMCHSFDLTCSSLLKRLQCPPDLSEPHACNSSMVDWVGECSCGTAGYSFGKAVSQLLLDESLIGHLSAYYYDGPFSDPYQTLIASG